eukprot:TRINITY_DN27553_c0_g1_i1.p3 TRINITY_DN27553_c0_g1~~TRINITY_DN27553_c0_g1_i1.p3  ORF type:complete len:134 (+),score=39.02 TRINITY_DN27553_c0_g1_i1:77-478(+)
MEAKKELSKNLSKMKFMQRIEQAEQRQQQEQALARELRDSHWSTSGVGKGIALPDDQNVALSRKPGRRSFGGFNPNVENIGKAPAPVAPPPAQEAPDVSDAEMAQRYDKRKGSDNPYGPRGRNDKKKKRSHDD